MTNIENKLRLFIADSEETFNYVVNNVNEAFTFPFAPSRYDYLHYSDEELKQSIKAWIQQRLIDAIINKNPLIIVDKSYLGEDNINELLLYAQHYTVITLWEMKLL